MLMIAFDVHLQPCLPPTRQNNKYASKSALLVLSIRIPFKMKYVAKAITICRILFLSFKI